MLAGIKVTIGLVSNSVSIISDGLNNFSDCITSLITLVSAGLAGRLPDRAGGASDRTALRYSFRQ